MNAGVVGLVFCGACVCGVLLGVLGLCGLILYQYWRDMGRYWGGDPYDPRA